MGEIAEFLAAEWVVAEILDHSAAVSIGVRLFKLIIRQSRESFEQQRPDLIFPEQVHNLLMRQDGVCKRSEAADRHNSENCQETNTQKAPKTGNCAGPGLFIDRKSTRLNSSSAN